MLHAPWVQLACCPKSTEEEYKSVAVNPGLLFPAACSDLFHGTASWLRASLSLGDLPAKPNKVLEVFAVLGSPSQNRLSGKVLLSVSVSPLFFLSSFLCHVMDQDALTQSPSPR